MVPRVLVVESAGNLWGSERVLLDMLAARKQVEYGVCCPPGKPILAKLNDLKIPTFPVFVEDLHQKSKFHRLRAAWGVVRAARQFRPGVIYLNQAGCARVAALAARYLRLPMVAHVRIFEDAEYLARLGTNLHLIKEIVSISREITKELSKFDPLRTCQIKTIYDGYAPQEKLDWRRSIRNSKVSNSMVCVGRMVPMKGQDILVEALAVLRGEKMNVSCAMVGSGDRFWIDLQVRSRALGLESSITWMGFQPEPLTILRGAELLVLPSHREPLGRVLFEAWECGCIPIAFRGSGGAAEILQASGGGLLYESQDPRALGDCIKRALALDARERGKFVERGCAWLAQNCSPNAYAGEMEAIFCTTGAK